MSKVATNLLGKTVEILRFTQSFPSESYIEARGIVRIVSVSKSLYITIELDTTQQRGSLRTYDVIDSSIEIKPIPDLLPETNWKAVAEDLLKSEYEGFGISYTVRDELIKKHTK